MELPKRHNPKYGPCDGEMGCHTVIEPHGRIEKDTQSVQLTSHRLKPEEGAGDREQVRDLLKKGSEQAENSKSPKVEPVAWETTVIIRPTGMYRPTIGTVPMRSDTSPSRRSGSWTQQHTPVMRVWTWN